MQLGYHLSSEEHDATTLVRLAGRAEEVGFGFATIADHFHPWTDAQGQSPFGGGAPGRPPPPARRVPRGPGGPLPPHQAPPGDRGESRSDGRRDARRPL